MSVNLGTYALISALAIGGVVAQQQYSQPAGPPETDATVQQDAQQNAQPNQNNQNGYSSTPIGTTSGVLDCNTLMTRHQQMSAELDKLDEQVNSQLTQMKEATSDRTKLDATMGVVETLVNQRKQIRDRTTPMLHETLHFMMTNAGGDLKTSCPQLTDLLQKGTMNGAHTDHGQQDQGGPDDLELQR